jgi:CRP-like cAMP-binding protein
MTASALALEATQVVSIDADELLALCEQNHTLGYQVMRRMSHSLANRLIATRLQLLDLFADSPVPSPPGPL